MSASSIPPNPAASPQTAPEFRSYRRFVNLLVLSIIFVGAGYLLVSVGVSIYRQRRAVPSGTPVSAEVTLVEQRSCWQELSDLSERLRKHLEKSHYLLDGYDQNEAQRWADEGAIWRNGWRALGSRCRLSGGGRKGLEEMVAAYRELYDTEAIYTKELLRFGREQAPRLDRIRQRITRIGQRLEREQARAGDQTP